MAKNDTSSQDFLEVGQKMADGSVYVGLTDDFVGLTGNDMQVYAMPTNLDVTMTFTEAAKRVEQLNADKALGHHDWQIGSIEVMRLMRRNQDEGALKGTFNTSGNKAGDSDYPSYPVCYWSSTQDPQGWGNTFIRFRDAFLYPTEDGGSVLHPERMSCRPVRLVAVPPAPPWHKRAPSGIVGDYF